MERTSSRSRHSTTVSPGRPTRRSGRPTGNRWHFTGTWRAHCRCSCWMCVRARSGSSPRWGATRIRPGLPTAVISPLFPTGRVTASCGSSISTPAEYGHCCSRAARVCRLGLHGFRRLLLPPPDRRDRMKSVSLLLALGLGAAVFAAASCGGNPAPQNTTPAVDTAAENQRVRDSIAAAEAERARQAQAEAERIAAQRRADSLAALARSGEEVRSTLAAMIHFDLDKSNIRPEDAATLDQKVAILQANPELRIRIGGHCDERGSDEYNLALGNRRAQSGKQYLVSHGIDASRIETQSWGEEKPLVDGHDESAWSQNRRDEFEIISGGDNIRRP